MNDNVFLKEEYINQKLINGYNSKAVYKFDNIFEFLNFCYTHKWNTENSITYYDDEEECMYIKHI